MPDRDVEQRTTRYYVANVNTGKAGAALRKAGLRDVKTRGGSTVTFGGDRGKAARALAAVGQEATIAPDYLRTTADTPELHELRDAMEPRDLRRVERCQRGSGLPCFPWATATGFLTALADGAHQGHRVEPQLHRGQDGGQPGGGEGRGRRQGQPVQPLRLHPRARRCRRLVLRRVHRGPGRPFQPDAPARVHDTRDPVFNPGAQPVRHSSAPSTCRSPEARSVSHRRARSRPSCSTSPPINPPTPAS